jgi:hypothetical protein
VANCNGKEVALIVLGPALFGSQSDENLPLVLKTTAEKLSSAGSFENEEERGSLRQKLASQFVNVQ